MNYKQWLVPKLRRLPALYEAVKNIPDEIRTLELELRSIRSAAAGGVSVSGGEENRVEAKMIANLAELDQLSRNLEIAKRQIDEVEKAMSILSPAERRVLDVFYVQQISRPVETLMEELGYEKSQIYRLKDKALVNLGVALFGIVEA